MYIETVYERLNRLMRQKETMVCCGLDPDLTKIAPATGTKEQVVINFLRQVVTDTVEHVCAYKIQKAFFDLLPGGHDALCEVVRIIRTYDPDVPVFIDCKIGDIDNTMGAYLSNLFGEIKADGVVVNPYMGTEVITPFTTEDYWFRSALVLVKTSNPGSWMIQDERLQNGQMVWEAVLRHTMRFNHNQNLIPILASTTDVDLSNVRMLIGGSVPVLFAGYGSQGGTLDQFRGLLDADGYGVFVNSSRGLLYPEGMTTNKAVIQMKEALNEAR